MRVQKRIGVLQGSPSRVTMMVPLRVASRVLFQGYLPSKVLSAFFVGSIGSRVEFVLALVVVAMSYPYLERRNPKH